MPAPAATAACSPPGIRWRGKPPGRSRRTCRCGAARWRPPADLVFYGTMDGWFKAVDARTGELMWQFKTGSGIIGQPISLRGPDGRAIHRRACPASAAGPARSSSATSIRATRPARRLRQCDARPQGQDQHRRDAVCVRPAAITGEAPPSMALLASAGDRRLPAREARDTPALHLPGAVAADGAVHAPARRSPPPPRRSGRAALREATPIHINEGERLYPLVQLQRLPRQRRRRHRAGADGRPTGATAAASSRFTRRICEGRPNGMPSFRGKIPDAQAWEIAAYVRALSGNVPKDAAPSRREGMAATPPLDALPAEPARNGDPDRQVPCPRHEARAVGSPARPGPRHSAAAITCSPRCSPTGEQASRHRSALESDAVRCACRCMCWCWPPRHWRCDRASRNAAPSTEHDRAIAGGLLAWSR